MKKSYLVLILTLFVLVGCGGDVANGRKSINSLHEIIIPSAHKLNIPESSKIQRANWEGVVELTDGFSITNDENILSFKIQSLRIEDGTATHHSIFIDTDSNPNTGYRNTRWNAELGAEYLIDGNNLLRYAGEGWNWTFVARIDRNVNANLNTDELELEFNRNLIDTDGDIRATTYLIDDNWMIIQQFNTVNYTLTNTHLEDEAFIINDDANTITFTIQNSRIEDGTASHHSIFIDADNNPQTGYRNTRWNAELGAEYLIDGNTILRHSGDGWNWTFVARIDTRIDADILEIALSTNILDTEGTIRAVAYLIDDNWRVLQQYSHDSYNLSNEDPQVENNNFQITDNQDTITISMQSPTIEDGTAVGYSIFIDSDNNQNTGYINDRWHANLGAEYLIGGNILYEHAADGWHWNEVGRVDRIINGDTITITISKNIINDLTQTFRTTAYLQNDQWIVINRFDTITHTNEDELPPIDHGTLSISHDITRFYITIENEDIRGNTNSEVYIDADNDRNTGFIINGIGADYRIINTQLSRFRNNTQEWVEPTNVQRFMGENQIELSVFRSRIRSRRNIALTANLLNENNQIIHTLEPITYEVRGDDDEITLSLEDPERYIFTIHSPLIGNGGFSAEHGGEVRSLHLAIDSDNYRFTGNVMNDVGADYFTNSWRSFGRFIGLEGAESWSDRWEWYDSEEVHVNVGEHIVNISIPRYYLLSENGIINVGSTFNNENGHFYWTNKYEFDINQN